MSHSLHPPQTESRLAYCFAVQLVSFLSSVLLSCNAGPLHVWCPPGSLCDAPTGAWGLGVLSLLAVPQVIKSFVTDP